MPITSTNMGLPIPTVGVDPSPTWATLLNQCLTIIDGHNHTNGSGVPIVPGAININSDLTFNSNNAIALRASRFTAQGSPIPASGSDLNEVYVSGVDLYYNDGNGNQVRITQSGGVAGSPGSISNLSSPASAAYVSANGKFVWQQDANTSADMDFGSAIMRNDTANSFALTLQPPTLGANYSITLPALPASQKIMTLDASGIMSAPYTVDGSTIAISGNVLGVPAGGITATQMANQTITATQIASQTITQGKLALRTVSSTAPVGGVLTSGAASPSTSSTSFVAASGLSGSLVTTGRPVSVRLAGTSSGSNVAVLGNANIQNQVLGYIEFLNGSTVIEQFNFGATVVFASTSFIEILTPCSSFSALDFAGAGTQSYSVKFRVFDSSQTVLIANAQLVAYET